MKALLFKFICFDVKKELEKKGGGRGVDHFNAA
jgi:hypothetical protein